MLRRTSLTTMYFSLSQRRLRWLGQVLRMGAERIPMSLLYCELVVGKRNRDRTKLRFKDVCKRDLKSLNIRSDELELLANDRTKWRSTVHKRLKEMKKKPKKMNKWEQNEFYSILFYLFVLLCTICLFCLLHHCAFKFIIIIYFYSLCTITHSWSRLITNFLLTFLFSLLL